MSTSDLKLKLIAQIIAIDDRILLDRIEETIKSNLLVNEPALTYEKIASEKIYVFNQWQQKRIDMALKQVENGEFLTEEEDKKEMERWFKEEDEKLIRQ
jgi:predicted transcriptional regulator|nr:hypothetical protein [uncultured Flavobacterium sp.]